jgi:short-subunit dehydrogenase
MKNKKTAVITGASSGIGKAFALHFAEKGYDLIITGRRIEKLTAVANQIQEQFGVLVETILVELSEVKEALKLFNLIKSKENIFVLVNNAGFGSGVEFCQNELSNHLQMLHTHVDASVELVYAVLPQMIRRREGTIINVSSLGAYMPAPGSSIYSATKLFLKSFTESLHMELHKYGIKVQCLCPGFTHTEFHQHRESCRSGPGNGLLWMDAKTVLKKSVKALKNENIICIPGTINKLLVGLSVILPRKLYYWLMQKSGSKPHKTQLANENGNEIIVPGFLNNMNCVLQKWIPENVRLTLLEGGNSSELSMPNLLKFS